MFCGLYYKRMTIVNDDSRVVNKLEASLIGDARVVVYDHHMFIVQATAKDKSNLYLIFLWNIIKIINELTIKINKNILIIQSMDKLELTGQNLGRVFNFRFGHLHAEHFWCYQVKLPNLKLKPQPKQLLGYLPLVIALPGQS